MLLCIFNGQNINILDPIYWLWYFIIHHCCFFFIDLHLLLLEPLELVIEGFHMVFLSGSYSSAFSHFSSVIPFVLFPFSCLLYSLICFSIISPYANLYSYCTIFFGHFFAPVLPSSFLFFPKFSHLTNSHLFHFPASFLPLPFQVTFLTMLLTPLLILEINILLVLLTPFFFDSYLPVL